MNKIYIYFFLILIASLFSYIFNEHIINENIIIDYLEDQLSYERILQLIDARSNWSWLNYSLLPIIYLIKFSLISMWILCCSIIVGYKLKLKSIFEIVIISEFVWLLPSIVAIIWFSLFNSSYTMTDIQHFAPLSLLSIFDANYVEDWLIIPLKALNLFEVIYLFVLTYLFKEIINEDFNSSLNFMLPVYGSALLVWIVFISFISINLLV